MIALVCVLCLCPVEKPSLRICLVSTHGSQKLGQSIILFNSKTILQDSVREDLPTGAQMLVSTLACVEAH